MGQRHLNSYKSNSGSKDQNVLHFRQKSLRKGNSGDFMCRMPFLLKTPTNVMSPTADNCREINGVQEE